MNRRALLLGLCALACTWIAPGCRPQQPLSLAPATTTAEPAEEHSLTEPETTEPEATKPGATKPEATKPEAAAEQTAQEGSARMSIKKSSFGKTQEGREIDLYTFSNGRGLTVKMINYGAIVVAVETPDRDGSAANINLGFDSLDGYLQRHPYFGATVGRCCNRIAKGKFTLDGKQYALATNNDPNHLHGGEVGFDKVIWSAEPVQTDDAVGVKFQHLSKDGEEGYPGNLAVKATYTLTRQNQLVVEFTATTDKATPVNLTNHCYWNLSGAGAGTIYDHQLTIAADKYLPVDETLIPTGKLADVAGTPLDFRQPRAIGEQLKEIEADPQGYDHCFALRNQDGGMALAARVSDPKSGRVMEIHTTQPGLQFYSGNFLDGSESNGGNAQHTAFCLETQHYPDSPNQPAFATTILKPGETYRQKTIHQFSTQ